MIYKSTDKCRKEGISHADVVKNIKLFEFDFVFDLSTKFFHHSKLLTLELQLLRLGLFFILQFDVSTVKRKDVIKHLFLEHKKRHHSAIEHWIVCKSNLKKNWKCNQKYKKSRYQIIKRILPSHIASLQPFHKISHEYQKFSNYLKIVMK